MTTMRRLGRAIAVLAPALFILGAVMLTSKAWHDAGVICWGLAFAVLYIRMDRMDERVGQLASKETRAGE